MRAIFIERSGGPEVLQVRDVATPQPAPGEVAIAVKAAGVNFADILARQGLYPPAPTRTRTSRAAAISAR